MSARRIQIAASEVLGMPGTGGAATADSLLALALARHGHDVELLVAPGRTIEPLAEPWAGLYNTHGVRVRRLEQRGTVRPPYLAPTLAVLEAARASEPDVLVADDWRGLAWASLRTRQLARGLGGTAVVLYCHGPARMLAEFAQKVPDTLARFGEEVAERAALELADAAVSPSAWLFDWQREREWPAPRAPHVVPCLWRSVALGEARPSSPPRARIRRLAFFGQLREGKGVRVFLESLDALGDLLDGLDVLFLGRETPRWTTERVRRSLSPASLARIASLRFETGLDPASALAELRTPGTLAVVPSLLDNSPYAVSECLESGIPFVAARIGGIPELVAPSDHERVLFEPRSEHLAAALRSALEAETVPAPAAPGFDPQAALATWLELVESVKPHSTPRRSRAHTVSIVVASEQARAQSPGTPDAEVEVVEARTRRAGLARATGDWIVFLDADDEADDSLLGALLDAQAASGADAVTTAVRPADATDAVQLFLGDPGALGLVENQYGVIALVRRELLDESDVLYGTGDPDWPMLAALALRGARIVSLPEAHATHRGRPGRVTDVPGEGLVVLRLFETASPRHDTAQLTATLGAALLRADATAPVPPRGGGFLSRGLRFLRREGPRGLGARIRAGASD